MTHTPFSGVMTAIITPFQQDGSVDFESFHRIIENQKKAGIDGIVVLGSTGESPTLTPSEEQSLVQEALGHQSSTFSVYVGTGSNVTTTTIEKSKKYSQIKSTQTGQTPRGVMVVTPYYNRPNQHHLQKHYAEVCRAVPDTSVCLYNVPVRTGTQILPQTLSHIVKNNPNVVAIKEAAGNLSIITEMKIALQAIGKENIGILSGDDASFAPALIAGATGVISVTSHIIPSIMVNMLKAYQEKNTEKLQQLHIASYCINQGIFSVPNPVGVKWTFSHLGMCENVLRAPLYPAEGTELEVLKNILHTLQKNNISVLV
jgi:4-hydroxy-tetrahydrodipicolinate synthase